MAKIDVTPEFRCATDEEVDRQVQRKRTRSSKGSKGGVRIAVGTSLTIWVLLKVGGRRPLYLPFNYSDKPTIFGVPRHPYFKKPPYWLHGYGWEWLTTLLSFLFSFSRTIRQSTLSKRYRTLCMNMVSIKVSCDNQVRIESLCLAHGHSLLCCKSVTCW